MCTGMMWRWDLTAALGWQAVAKPWYGQGSWLAHSADGPWEEVRPAMLMHAMPLVVMRWCRLL